MWFGLYSRYNKKMDSSGFEHIFAGSDREDKCFANVLFFFVNIKINTFCNNRRDQGRKGVRFPQLDPVLSSREKRTAELLQPQLQWAGTHPQYWRQYSLLIYTVMCNTGFYSSVSSFPLLTVDYLPRCHGDAVQVGRILQAGRFCSHRLQP